MARTRAKAPQRRAKVPFSHHIRRHHPGMFIGFRLQCLGGTVSVITVKPTLRTGSRLLQDDSHAGAVVGGDEVLHQRLAHDVLHAVLGERGGALVPLVHAAVLVDAEDGRVRRVDERPQVLRHALQLRLCLLALADVLPDAHHAHGVALLVAASGGVQQHLHALPLLGEERELEVGRLDALQGVVQDIAHHRLVLRVDELLHQVAPHHLLLGALGDLRGLLVPLVHVAKRVDTEDGRVRRVDERAQVLRHALQLALRLLALGDVLSYTHHTHNVVVLVPAGGGVQQHLHALLVLGEQRKLEVRSLLALEGVLQHKLHDILVVRVDELLHQVVAQHLLLRKPGDLRGLVVPLVHQALLVDTEDGRVRRVDERAQVLRHAL
eukprot:1194308-Prorocentrum_minimum.AAC.3